MPFNHMLPLLEYTITVPTAVEGRYLFAARTQLSTIVVAHQISFSTFPGLLELENSLPDFLKNPSVKAPQRVTTTQAGFLKRRYREEQQLADMAKSIQDEKVRRTQPPKQLRFLQKIEKPVPRPPTPSVDVPSQVR